MPLRDIEKIFIKFAEHNIANKLKKSSKLHRLIQTLFTNILKWIGNPWQFFKLLKGEQLPALLHNDKSVKPNTLKNNFWYRLLTPPNFFKLVKFSRERQVICRAKSRFFSPYFENQFLWLYKTVFFFLFIYFFLVSCQIQ